MEYFLGSLITFVIMAYFGNKSQKVFKQKQVGIRFSQSYIDNLISQRIMSVIIPKQKPRQSLKLEQNNHVRVMIIEGEAYWITNQTLYVAQIVDGEVDKETTKVVDTMSMNAVQLEKTQFIVQKLTEGKGNDSGYPWKP